MQPEIRAAQQDDLKRIVDIYNSTIASRLVTADLEPVTIESRAHWLTERDPERHPVMVFDLEGHIAGWFALQPFHERAAYDATAEVSVYVDNRFRGQGLGRHAIQSVARHAAKVHIDRLVGLVFAHNEPSKRLMTSNGFEIWGRLPGVAVLDGVRRDLLLFGRALTPDTH